MLVLTPLKKYRKRNNRKPRVVQSAPIPALVVTGVVSVVSDGDDRHVTIAFNTTEEVPLAEASEASGGKWTMRYQGVWYDGVGLLNNAYDRLVVIFLRSHNEAGPDEISYANNPSDVGDVGGRMLAAFGMQF